jgi:hypothetical protein
MSPKCLEAMGGTPPEFPFYLTDVKVNRSQPTSSRSVAQQHTSYTEQQPVAQQVYTHQEVYNPSASANTQPAQIAPQAQAVSIIFSPLLLSSSINSIYSHAPLRFHHFSRQQLEYCLLDGSPYRTLQVEIHTTPIRLQAR